MKNQKRTKENMKDNDIEMNVCVEKKEDTVKKEDTDTKQFRIIDLDIVKLSENASHKILIDAKDHTNAIEIFYKRFPNAGSHIIVIPEDCIVEHTGSITPQTTVKIQKKRPLIKFESKQK